MRATRLGQQLSRSATTALGLILLLAGVAESDEHLKVVHAFTMAGAPGAYMVEGSNGDFYGTEPVGGTFFGGTAFKLSKAGSLTTIHSFDCDTEGCGPNAPLVRGRNGHFYGTTPY